MAGDRKPRDERDSAARAALAAFRARLTALAARQGRSIDSLAREAGCSDPFMHYVAR